MPKKSKGAGKDAKSAKGVPGDLGTSPGGESAEQALGPTAQDVLELVTARKKLEKSLKAQEALKEENESLRQQTAQEQVHQTEIFSYLNKELVDKSHALEVLERQVHMLEGNVSNQRTNFDHKLIEEKRAARDLTTKLAREVGRYEKELGDLNNFIARKATLERELEDTRTELLKERKKHEQIITELERKTLQEKDRLRKEMEVKIREAKETFMKSTDAQLESTTKKTIQDNEQMASELAFQNVETDRLLQKNKKLTEENNSCRRELSIHLQGEEELAKRNHAYLNTIQSLLSKLKFLETANLELEDAASTKKDGTIASAAAAFRQRAIILQESLEEAYKGLDGMQSEVEEKSEELKRVLSNKDDLGMLILRAAEDTKKKFNIELVSVGSHSGGASKEDETSEKTRSAPPRLQDLPPEVREKALNYLQSRLHDLQSEVSATAKTARGAGAPVLPSIAKAKVPTKPDVSRSASGPALESRTEYMVAGIMSKMHL